MCQISSLSTDASYSAAEEERGIRSTGGGLELDCLEISARAEGSWAFRLVSPFSGLIVYQISSKSTRAAYSTNATEGLIHAMRRTGA